MSQPSDTSRSEPEIAHLRAEIEDLRLRQQEFQSLRDHLAKLQLQYSNLESEKESDQVCFYAERVAQERTLAAKRGQVSLLRSELRESTGQLKRLQADFLEYSALCEESAQEVLRLRAEISSSIKQDNSADIQARQLQANMSALQAEKQKSQKLKVQLECELALIKEQVGQLMKVKAEQEDDQLAYGHELKSVEGSVQGLKARLQGLRSECQEAEEAALESEATGSEVQQDLIQVEAIVEKFRLETAQLRRAIAAQQGKGRQNDIQVRNILSSIAGLAKQKDEAVQQMVQIRVECEEISQANGKLRKEVQKCKNHVELVDRQNELLVQELQRYAREDEAIRQTLNRKERIRGSRARLAASRANI